MDQTAVDPLLDVFEDFRRDVEHLQRTENVNFREELLLRVYPLIGKVIETLTERMDVMYDELAESNAISAELVGRVLALFGRYGDTLRAACTDGGEKPGADVVTELEREAQTVSAELVALIGAETGTTGVAPEPKPEAANE